MSTVAFGFLRALLVAAMALQPLLANSAEPAPARDGQHDFDFEIGTWKTHVSRLVQPLTGSKTWVEYEGTSVVKKLWDGGANVVLLDVKGPKGRIEGLSLRLYNPESRQWSLNFANRAGNARPAHHRRIQQRPRRVLQPGNNQRPRDPGPIRHLRYHADILSLRTSLLRGWRQDVGSELDRNGYPDG